MQSQSNKRKCASCTMCGQQFGQGEPPLAAVGQPQHTTSLRARPLHHWRHRSPQIAKQSKPSLASETACSTQSHLCRLCFPYTSIPTSTPQRPDGDDRREHGLPMVEHSPTDRNQGLARKHVRSAASTTQAGPAASTTCHLACHPAPRARFVHVRAKHGRYSSSAAGFSWADRPRTHLMRIVPASWRRDFFNAEDWLALWAIVKAECDIASTAQGRPRSRAEQTEARVRKGFARARDRRRALAAARNALPVPVTRDIVQETTDLYPVPKCHAC